MGQLTWQPASGYFPGKQEEKTPESLLAGPQGPSAPGLVQPLCLFSIPSQSQGPEEMVLYRGLGAMPSDMSPDWGLLKNLVPQSPAATRD